MKALLTKALLGYAAVYIPAMGMAITSGYGKLWPDVVILTSVSFFVGFAFGVSSSDNDNAPT